MKRLANLFRRRPVRPQLIRRGPLGVELLEERVNPGSGTFKNGVYNFCVSIRFKATDAQLAEIRTAFQNASQVFADATDGQQRFGTITLINDSGASQAAEYYINAGSGRAYATYGKYGTRGEHVNLYFDSNFKAVDGADGDAYTIAHEHVHHAFGIADEYSGPAGDAENAPVPAAGDSPTLNYSLMDNYFTRGGRAGTGTTYTLNELSVKSNHDPDGDTYQTSMNGVSDWEMIAAHPTRKATAPTGLPVDAAPAAHTVTFRNGTGVLTAMLVLDHSGSMSTDDRLTFAKSAATQFVGLVKTNEAIGVASFDDTATVNFALTTVTGNATKTAANTAINGITLGGSTNIGGGLQIALNQILARPERSCNEIIVLLSDGDHNTGTDPDSVIPALQDAGVTVITIGVGSGISSSGQATLQRIATQTGGKFYRVSSAFDQISAFSELANEATGSGLLAQAPLTLTSNQTKETPVPIETGAKLATFTVNRANTNDQITVTLKTPTGTVITAADAGTNPNVTVMTTANSVTYQIANPQAGTWQVVTAAGTVTNGQVEVQGFADSDSAQLLVSVKNDTVKFPEAVTLFATPQYKGQNVIGATVTGTVTRPSGSKVQITLFDDGLAAHGDGVAGDGIYSARFSTYEASGNGTYTFEVTATSSNGMTFSGEDLHKKNPSSSVAVPAFTRIASTTAVVTDIPSTLPKADLRITATVSPTSPGIGDNITYVLTVENLGTSAAADVVATNTLPAGVTVVSTTPSVGTVTNKGLVYTYSLGSLSSGAKATITLVVKATATGKLTNNFTVAATTEDPVLTNNSGSIDVTVSEGFNFAKLGAYRSSDGSWSLDSDGTFGFDLSKDQVFRSFSPPGVQGVAGDWTGTGRAYIGDFKDGVWHLDLNNNGVVDSGETFNFGRTGDKPVVGDWNGDGKTKLGVFRAGPDGISGQFVLDSNNSRSIDSSDESFIFGIASDRVVVGDWTGDKKSKVGVFRDAKDFNPQAAGAAVFTLDINNNHQFDAGIDEVFIFGVFTDGLVVGNWNGQGSDKVGVYRDGAAAMNAPGVALFSLDTNGNRGFDQGIDAVFLYGLTTDQFVGGNWKVTPPLVALHAAEGEGPGGGATLTEDDLAPVLQEAINLWAMRGANAEQLAGVRFQIMNLGDGRLGMARPGEVLLDDDGAGWGWSRQADGVDGEQIDLLTAVTHELGHELGLEHDSEELMASTLARGIRLQPASLAVDAVFADLGAATM